MQKLTQQQRLTLCLQTILIKGDAMYSKSDNKEIMINYKADKIISKKLNHFFLDFKQAEKCQ